MILLLISTPLVARGSALANLGFGGKGGDWIEYGLQLAIGSSGEEWVRTDFLNVAGTMVTVRVTVYTATWTETNETRTVDLASQDDFSMRLFRIRVYFIPGGLGINDSVYLGDEFGTENIVGETTGSYAGVNRRVIYANFSTPQGSNYIFYWDKQTGVLTEGGMFVAGGALNAVFLTGTNMWGGVEYSLLLWIIIIIAIVLGVLTSRKNILKKLHRKRDA
jgi:hypothetical protein